jgi:hypothetical protein
VKPEREPERQKDSERLGGSLREKRMGGGGESLRESLRDSEREREREMERVLWKEPCD